VVDKKSGAKLACKSISKRKLTTPEDIADVQREVQVRARRGVVVVLWVLTVSWLGRVFGGGSGRLMTGRQAVAV
jgi:hypothetical protein